MRTAKPLGVPPGVPVNPPTWPLDLGGSTAPVPPASWGRSSQGSELSKCAFSGLQQRVSNPPADDSTRKPLHTCLNASGCNKRATFQLSGGHNEKHKGVGVIIRITTLGVQTQGFELENLGGGGKLRRGEKKKQISGLLPWSQQQEMMQAPKWRQKG